MNKGFTMIELILVVGMLAILSYLAVPISLNFYRSQMVEGSRDDLISLSNRARHSALLMKGDSQYGIYIDTSDDDELENLIVYKGTNYNSGRDSDLDEIYPQRPNIFLTFTGTDVLVVDRDINFSKLTGLTTATGTITLTYGGNKESRAVSVDQYGNVSATSTSN